MASEETLLDTEVTEEEDDSLIEDELEQSEEEESTEEVEEPAVSKSDLDALNKTLNELRSEVGRLQSIEARLKRVEDPSDRAAVEQSLRAEINRVNEVAASLVFGLDETAFVDPDVRRKVQDFLNEARTKAERQALLDELKKEIQPVQRPTVPPENAWYTDAVAEFEEEWADRIADEGYNNTLEGEFRDAWLKAGAAIRSGRPLSEARSIMREHLKSLKAERQVARQRNQAKKNAGGGVPKAAGGTVGVLADPNKSVAEKTEYLRSLGITIG